MRVQGQPCWYELTTTDLAGAAAFYRDILGWQIRDSGHAAFIYHLASTGGGMVAGLIADDAASGAPPNWLIYYAADDCDQSVAQAVAAGAMIIVPPSNVAGTGRFAVLRDPQGAAFGLLQPDMTGMSEADKARAASGKGAFDPAQAGHVQWNELMSADPSAGFDFYAGLFGWSKGETMPMGEMGTYQLVRHQDRDIGAMMPLGDAPFSTWLPYFGVAESIGKVVARITAAGGHLQHGPSEVPGAMWIAVATDPQGAWFAVLGPK